MGARFISPYSAYALQIRSGYLPIVRVVSPPLEDVAITGSTIGRRRVVAVPRRRGSSESPRRWPDPLGAASRSGKNVDVRQ
jgi:hypothetical protein